MALIRDAAREAIETVADMTREEFLQSEGGQAAVALDAEFSPLFSGRAVELIDPEHLSPYTRDQILAEAVEIFPVDHRDLEKVS